MGTFLKEKPTTIEECDDQILRRLIGKITMY